MKVSALKFYVSLKAPGLEAIVGLHRLAAFTFRGKGVGTVVVC